MLLNLSNHHSSTWQENQLKTAIDKYESIIDLDFPRIEPELSEQEIEKIAQEYFNKCATFLSDRDKANAIHIMGEHNFVFNIVNKFLNAGLKCVASTTFRKSNIADNKKLSEFSFVKFREYRI